MNPKKNPKVDMDRYRGLFFLFGLTLTLAIVAYAFQYTTEKRILKPIEQKKTAEKVTINIPITKSPERKKPKKKEPSRLDYTKKPVVEPKVDPKPLKKKKKIDLGGLDTIDPEPDPLLLNPDPVPVSVSLERIARPAQCDGIRDKSEQLKCLNDWIYSFVNQRTVYPRACLEMRLEEKIYVEMVFDEFGGLESAKVVRGENDCFKQEALRVIKELPRFLPASNFGKPVRMKMVIPVNFKLS